MKEKLSDRIILVFAIIFIGMVGYWGYRSYYVKMPVESSPIPSPIWNTHVSEQAKFSFAYPSEWPIAVATQEQLQDAGEREKAESIMFKKEWELNADSSTIGIIDATHVENTYTLEDYIKLIDKETPLSSKTGTVMIPRPTINSVILGGEEAISVTKNSTMASFPKIALDYIVVKNGFLYRFTFNSVALEERAQSVEKIQKLLASIKFLD